MSKVANSYTGPNNTCDNTSCELNLIAEDVMPIADNGSVNVFASLYTYADDKDESTFKKIHLPIICVAAGDLYSMFYQTKLKRFNPFVLNKLIERVDKQSLINEMKTNYEEQTGNDRLNLTAQQKMTITQELNTEKINNRVQKIVHLNYNEFVESFDDELMWFDETPAVDAADAIPATVQIGTAQVGVVGDANYAAASSDYAPAVPAVPAVEYVPGFHTVRTSIEINVYSEALQTGAILVVHFSAFLNDDFEFEGIPEQAPVSFVDRDTNSIPAPKCGLCVTYDPSHSMP